MGLLGKEGARQVVDLCSSEVQGACRQCGTDGGINGTCLRDTGTHACQPTCVSGPKHRRAERAFTIGRILKSELHTDGHHILTEGGAPITNIGKYTFMPTQHSQGPGGMIRHPVMGFRRALPRVRWCCRGEVADIKLQPRSPALHLPYWENPRESHICLHSRTSSWVRCRCTSSGPRSSTPRHGAREKR